MGVAKIVNNNKTQCQLQRHNRVTFISLPISAEGQGIAQKKKHRWNIKNAEGSNYVQLQQLANCIRILEASYAYYITEEVYQNESIVNLNNAEKPGLDWVIYAKRRNRIIYFDNFGNLRLLKELKRYLANNVIECNRTPHQCYGTEQLQTALFTVFRNDWQAI